MLKCNLATELHTTEPYVPQKALHARDIWHEPQTRKPGQKPKKIPRPAGFRSSPLTSYVGLLPASSSASAAGRGASRKTGTSIELLLRRALSALGLRYRISNKLLGRPDLVFAGAKVLVFCDGDFWHGRDLKARLSKLKTGHNAPYWVAKIRGNVDRDLRTTAQLTAEGWKVLRYWESEIRSDVNRVAAHIQREVAGRSPTSSQTRKHQPSRAAAKIRR
jgi:DNA mismatch endonuclease, patch repair protein